MSVTNPAPALPSDLAITPLSETVRVSFTAPSDLDWTGCRIAMSTTTPVSSDSVVYDGPNTDIQIPAQALVPHYLKILMYDAFGDGEWSTEYTVTPLITVTPDALSYLLSVDTWPEPNTYAVDRNWAIDGHSKALISPEKAITRLRGPFSDAAWRFRYTTALGLTQTNSWINTTSTDYTQAANRASSTFYGLVLGEDPPGTFNETYDLYDNWNLICVPGIPDLGGPEPTYKNFCDFIESSNTNITIESAWIYDDDAGVSAVAGAGGPGNIEVRVSNRYLDYSKGIWLKCDIASGPENVTITGERIAVAWELFSGFSLVSIGSALGAEYGSDIGGFLADLTTETSAIESGADVVGVWWWSGSVQAWRSWNVDVPEFLNRYTSMESWHGVFLYIEGITEKLVFTPNLKLQYSHYKLSSTEEGDPISSITGFNSSNFSINQQTMTVTETAHGRGVRDNIKLEGFTPPSGLTSSEFNRQYSITSVTTDTYNVVLTQSASNNASGTGTLHTVYPSVLKVATLTTDASGDIDTVTTHSSNKVL